MSREERGSRDAGRDRDRTRGVGRDSRDDADRPRGEGRGRGREEESRGGRSGGGFRYQERSPDTYKKRGEQGGGDFDKYLSDSIKMFKPADGDNCIRILPPTWEGAEHFGLDIYVHYGVGPDSQTYLCTHKMQNKPCPICDEREKAAKDGDVDYADKLKPTKRVLVYLIDRNNEKDGAIVWSMPWTIDRDLCKLVVDKRSGDTLPIDNPDTGYDINFERKGKGDRTQYIGLAVARRESDLGNPKWLDDIQDHPLDSILQFYEYDHIAATFGGRSAKKSRDDKESDLDRQQNKDLREVETRGDRERASRSREPVFDWDGIHAMTFEELTALIDDQSLKIDPQDSKDDEELADWICEDMKISKAPARRAARDDHEDPKGKMDDLRRRRTSVD